MEAEPCRAASLDRSAAGYIWDGSSGPAGGPTEAPGTGRQRHNSLPERLQLSSSPPPHLPPFVFALALSRCNISYFLTVCLQLPEVKCGILSFLEKNNKYINFSLEPPQRKITPVKKRRDALSALVTRVLHPAVTFRRTMPLQ